MKRKTVFNLCFVIVLIVGLFFLWTSYAWKLFSCDIAGSYPCVETWSLNVTEKDLIEIIDTLKKEHPEIEPPNASYPTSGRHEYWYDILFYYQDTKEDVYTWLRQTDDSLYTIIALVSIGSHIDSLTPINEIKMDTKEINRDYSYFANKREIRKFENNILALIEEKIKQRKKNGT